MKTQEMIDQIRAQIHDITEDYSDDILIKYINTAIKSASDILVNVNNTLCLDEVTLKNGDDRPLNFRKFAGIYPVRFTGNKVEITDGTNEHTVRYFYGQPNVQKVDDELPFTDETVLIYIEQYASILAFNRNEYAVTQDNAILQNLRDSFLQNVGVE